MDLCPTKQWLLGVQWGGVGCRPHHFTGCTVSLQLLVLAYDLQLVGGVGSERAGPGEDRDRGKGGDGAGVIEACSERERERREA